MQLRRDAEIERLRQTDIAQAEAGYEVAVIERRDEQSRRYAAVENALNERKTREGAVLMMMP